MEVRILSSAPAQAPKNPMSSIEISTQRRNMVEQQIRTWEVLEDRILDLYYTYERPDFVDSASTDLAYADLQLPIGDDQVMLEPKTEARILQELAPRLIENILHIGTGSGFFAVLLSQLCSSLTTIEINPDLAERARKRFENLNIRNIQIVIADGLAGSPPAPPYDAIVLTGSIPIVLPKLLTALTSDGRLLAPVGVPPVCTVRRLRKMPGGVVSDDLFETWIPQLTNSHTPKAFTF